MLVLELSCMLSTSSWMPMKKTKDFMAYLRNSNDGHFFKLCPEHNSKKQSWGFTHSLLIRESVDRGAHPNLPAMSTPAICQTKPALGYNSQLHTAVMTAGMCALSATALQMVQDTYCTLYMLLCTCQICGGVSVSAVTVCCPSPPSLSWPPQSSTG